MGVHAGPEGRPSVVEIPAIGSECGAVHGGPPGVPRAAGAGIRRAPK